MLHLSLLQKISSLYEAEQHVYGIPEAGVAASREWATMEYAHRVELRKHAISRWKEYLESDGRMIPHPAIHIPEYRQMLSHPDGELIVEEA